jgi:hypothetical protein
MQKGTQKGGLGKGTRIRVLGFGLSKRVLKKGYSRRGTQQGQGEVHLSFTSFIRYSHGTAPPRRARGTPSGACRSLCGTQRAVHGSVGHPGVGFGLDGAVCRVLTGYSQGTHTGPLVTQCSACVSHHGVYSWVGERHRTEGDLACDARRVLDGYSKAGYRAHRSAPVRPHCGRRSGHIICTRTVRVIARAQRRPAFRHPFRPTSATPTRPHVCRRRCRRGRVRAMRSTRPAFPALPPFPPFSPPATPVPLAALCWALPPARDGTARAGSTMALRLAAATVVLRGTPAVLGTL